MGNSQGELVIGRSTTNKVGERLQWATLKHLLGS